MRGRVEFRQTKNFIVVSFWFGKLARANMKNILLNYRRHFFEIPIPLKNQIQYIQPLPSFVYQRLKTYLRKNKVDFKEVQYKGREAVKINNTLIVKVPYWSRTEIEKL